MRPLEHLYSVRCYSTCSLAKIVIDCFAHCMAMFCRTSRLKDLFGPLRLVCVFVVVYRHWSVAFECQIKTHDVCLPKAAVAVEKSPSSPGASAVEQEKRESKKKVEGMCWWFTENPPTKVTLLLVYPVGNSVFGVCFNVIFLVDVVFSLGLWLSVTRRMLQPKLVLFQSAQCIWSDWRVCCLWSSDDNNVKQSEGKKVLL